MNFTDIFEHNEPFEVEIERDDFTLHSQVWAHFSQREGIVIERVFVLGVDIRKELSEEDMETIKNRVTQLAEQAVEDYWSEREAKAEDAGAARREAFRESIEE